MVTNPDATSAADLYGHGTHVAGLLAGNGLALPASDWHFGCYIGAAPQATLVSIKVSDDHGNATVMDVIAGLQFVVDRGAAYGIRAVNLSLGSAAPRSYRVDPLDAAVEEVWAHGVVVVAAAGNRAALPMPSPTRRPTDPYIMTVGAIDDQGTKSTLDDSLAPWSSRGVTQDGIIKPDIVAPGAHIVAPLAPDSDFQLLCPTCVVDQRSFRLSGSSMANPIVAGIVADLISAHPGWTPDQVRGALTYVSDAIDETGKTRANMRLTADGAWAVAGDKALNAARRELQSNARLVASTLLDPVMFTIDPTRGSWGRASWRTAAGDLRASWGSGVLDLRLLRLRRHEPCPGFVGPRVLEHVLRRHPVGLRRAPRWHRRGHAARRFPAQSAGVGARGSPRRGSCARPRGGTPVPCRAGSSRRSGASS